MSRKKKCIRPYNNGQGTDAECEDISDIDGEGSSIHERDLMLNSPVNLSASTRVFSTAHKSCKQSTQSPLGHDSLCDFSDLDATLSHSDVLSGSCSPFSAFGTNDKKTVEDRCLSLCINIPNVDSLASSTKSSGLSCSFSIESLAKSSANSDMEDFKKTNLNRSFDYVFSQLPSSVHYNCHNSPKFSMATYAENITKNTSPKKPSELNSSFSISTLSVSAATPARVN